MPVANLCALCGQPLTASGGLCRGHDGSAEESWATVNRIMCDFFHRGIVPRRLGLAARMLDERSRAADAA